MSTIKVKQVRSRIRRPMNQKLNLDSLGLNKLNQVVELEDTPQIRGMIYKVRHLVEVVE